MILHGLGDRVRGDAAQDSNPAAPTTIRDEEARPGKPAAGFGIYRLIVRQRRSFAGIYSIVSRCFLLQSTTMFRHLRVLSGSPNWIFDPEVLFQDCGGRVPEAEMHLHLAHFESTQHDLQAMGEGEIGELNIFGDPAKARDGRDRTSLITAASRPSL